MKKGFTLIEILIVIGIVAILVSIGTSVYISAQKSSRDTRRKADLEQIRAAVEQFKSDNNSYPMDSRVIDIQGCGNNGPLQDDFNHTYLGAIPEDPYCQFAYYYYLASPEGCTEAVPCTDYTVYSHLEGDSICNNLPPDPQVCGAGDLACNYCLGPYGKK